MPDKIVTGTPGMIFQGVRRSYNRRSGWTNTLTWIGDKRFGPGIEQQLIDAGYETTYTDDGPNCIIEGTRAGIENTSQPEVPIDKWERQINRVEKSIYEHFDLVSELENAGNVAALRAQVEDREFDPVLGYDSAEAAALAEEWYDLIIAGVDSFVVFQPVVTYTRTVSDKYDKATLAKTNVGKIFTYAQMSSLEGAPAFVLDEKPAVPSGVFFDTTPGYFKNDPTFTAVAENKWEITTQYELGYWASKLFSPAT